VVSGNPEDVLEMLDGSAEGFSRMFDGFANYQIRQYLSDSCPQRH
jgi:hypothetical protein